MNSETNHPKGGIAGRLSMAGWRKHYVATMAADEEAWPHREPGGNLGRVFIILLLLHVFLIGAVVLYNVVSPKTPPAVTAAVKPSANPAATVAAANPATPGPTARTTPPATPEPPAETGTYEVRSGDNVPGIAAALGVHPEELIKLNNLDTTALYPGRKLLYPKKAAAPTPARTPAPLATRVTPPSTPMSLKTPPPPPVKTESPPKPAATAAHTADAPPAPPSAKTETADRPPSPPKTAARSETSGASPPKTEPRKSETARATPKTETKKTESPSRTAAKPEKPATPKESTAGRRIHVLGPKETLYSIARKYGVKVDDIQAINGIKDPTRMRNGTKLVIPPKN